MNFTSANIHKISTPWRRSYKKAKKKCRHIFWKHISHFHVEKRKWQNKINTLVCYTFEYFLTNHYLSGYGEMEFFGRDLCHCTL